MAERARPYVAPRIVPEIVMGCHVALHPVMNGPDQLHVEQLGHNNELLSLLVVNRGHADKTLSALALIANEVELRFGDGKRRFVVLGEHDLVVSTDLSAPVTLPRAVPQADGDPRHLEMMS